MLTFRYRKKAANISSTLNSSHMNQSSTISSPSRSRRRSTRSSGASDRMLLISYSPRMVCVQWIHSRTGTESSLRQDDQVVEGVREVPARRSGVQPRRRPTAHVSPHPSITTQATSHATAGQHCCCCSAQSLLQRPCVPYPLYLCQLRSRDLHLGRRPPS